MNTTAKILRENISEIMQLWQDVVTKEVYAAKEANAIALYDHLPNIIEDIADIMERQIKMVNVSEDTKYNEIIENSINHGKHRATTENYTVEQVVHEYIIFHRTLSEYLKARDGYSEKVSDLLKYVIETSILKSVGSFTRSIQEMQEKLIGVLAHDIRNPLSSAEMLLQMIRDDETGKFDEQMHAATERSVRKAIGLIEGLMDGIKVKAGEGMLLEFESKDLLPDIKWVHEEAEEIYASTIKLKCDAKNIIGVFDSVAIRRLLENLISNAVKYGANAKPITITVNDKAEYVEINVHNHGNPIPKEKQKHIFQFLGRENDDASLANKSWGMGLTLAEIVAVAHGGNIELKSNAESGTSFIVTLLKQFNKPGKRRTKLAFTKAQK